MNQEAKKLQEVQRELTERLLLEESGALRPMKVPDWPRLSTLSAMLRGGQCCILAGPQNVGKSYWVLNVLKAVLDQGERASYLPLEDDRAEFIKRAIALETSDYSYTDTDTEGASERLNYLISPEGKEVVGRYAGAVHQNPRTPTQADDGSYAVSSLTSDWVLSWMEREMKDKSRAIFIDPVTQINFGGGRNSLAVEEEFIRQALGMVAGYKATVIFVLHTKKLYGKPAGYLPGIEDLAGSSLWPKLCQTGVMLAAHEPKTSEVVRPGLFPGQPPRMQAVEHNRTVSIMRARYARGARMNLAYTQHDTKPIFTEHGVLSIGGRKD